MSFDEFFDHSWDVGAFNFFMKNSRITKLEHYDLRARATVGNSTSLGERLLRALRNIENAAQLLP